MTQVGRWWFLRVAGSRPGRNSVLRADAGNRGKWRDAGSWRKNDGHRPPLHEIANDLFGADHGTGGEGAFGGGDVDAISDDAVLIGIDEVEQAVP